ncbi:hypothetical protein D4R42_01845 [bacterium]|nr:MAG: hypothetical protein D4R42_01845 [bacterium]
MWYNEDEQNYPHFLFTKNMSSIDIEAYKQLGYDINKSKKGDLEETKEGVVSEKLPELDLKMSNEKIIKLTTKWQKTWEDDDKKSKWETQIKENEKYWLGKQKDTENVNGKACVDNLIFESLETFLPQATRRNPEPLVMLDAVEKISEEEKNLIVLAKDKVNQTYVTRVKDTLADIADKNKIRLKLKKAARTWAIYQLGVAKFGWDLDKDIPIVRMIRPQKMILDPDATIDEDGYTGERIGEHRKLPAYKILSILKGEYGTAEGKKLVKELIEKDTGTMVSFIEWWTPEYLCWTMGNAVLLKMKNPHWNYDSSEMPEQDENGAYDLNSPNVKVDEFGKVSAEPTEKIGNNHFNNPQMPYRFLTVFNLGDRPMDVTSLIGQNISNQDLINKRNKQITKNADSMNGGMVVSLANSGMTKAQGTEAVKALNKGGAIFTPTGSPDEAVKRQSAPALPNDVYNQLADTRNRLRDIFGVAGSSAGGLSAEKTVRGKIMNRGLDTDRIGGGLTEYLEQFADDIYNWFVQLLYVYDPAFNFIDGGVPPKIIISVKEGSLLPKDSTTIANQAMELAGMGKLADEDLFKRLEWPNPKELASNIWLQINAPHLLYKDNPLVLQALTGMQQQAQAEQEQTQRAKPKESKSMLKDVPIQPKAE